MVPPASADLPRQGGLPGLAPPLARLGRDPLACVELPVLRLQLLLRQRPDWREHPVVVIDEDRPQGLILEANQAARAHAIHPGQRYAHALGLARELRAGVVPPGVIGAGLAHVLALLRSFSPNIEVADDEPGLFWLDASGLLSLFDALSSWARAIVDGLKTEGFFALVAIGFSRFGAYAAVKSLLASMPPERAERALTEAGRVRVLTSPEAEDKLAKSVPLTYLGLPARARERLERLGVLTLGELLALPPASLMRRWGPEVLRLWRLARGELFAPLTPRPDVPPPELAERFDYLEHDAHRLLFCVKRLLDELVALLTPRQQVIAELVLELGREGNPIRERTVYQRHRFRPATPTLDAALLLDLVRLRLENVDLTMGVVELRLIALDVPASPEQLRLFQHGPHQDRAAAGRALARILAELGEDSVVFAVLRDGHLPRARMGFQRSDGSPLKAPEPARPEGPPPLIRRLHPQAEPLPPRPRDLRNDGWQPRDPAQGPIVAVHGPFVIAGGWWLGLADAATPSAEVHREYAFVETRRGDLLWIHHDRRRRRWLEEGRFE